MRSYGLKRAVEGLVVLVLLGSLAWGYPVVARMREESARRQLEFENIPLNAGQEAELEREFKGQQPALARVRTVAIQEKNIGYFVSVLETLAAESQVVVEVPEVKEIIPLDESGQPLPIVGPVRDIELKIQAKGTPPDLLRYLYAVEHVPYLVAIPDWSVSAADQTRAQAQRAPVASPSPAAPPPVPPATLAARLVLTVARDE
jgi:hypothetical protein